MTDEEIDIWVDRLRIQADCATYDAYLYAPGASGPHIVPVAVQEGSSLPIKLNNLRVNDWIDLWPDVLSGVIDLNVHRFTSEYLAAEGATFTVFWSSIPSVTERRTFNEPIQHLFPLEPNGWNGMAIIIKHRSFCVVDATEDDSFAVEHVMRTCVYLSVAHIPH